MRVYEKSRRSVVKAITYRILILITNFVVTYLVTGEIDIATQVALITLIINTVFYYLHERLWNKLTWGKIRSK